MHAKTLKLVGADAGGDGLARLVEPATTRARQVAASSFARLRYLLEQYLAIARDRNGGMQFMVAAGKGP